MCISPTWEDSLDNNYSLYASNSDFTEFLHSTCGSQPMGAMVLYCLGSAPMHSRLEVETHVASQSRKLLLFLF